MILSGRRRGGGGGLNLPQSDSKRRKERDCVGVAFGRARGIARATCGVLKLRSRALENILIYSEMS